MAGIGEASAILSVAQIGITLSKTLITYIEEVKGAPSHIQSIGNEILTTSERLKDIGELVDQNSQTKAFSEEGINSAVRSSTECQQIIKEVKNVLFKGGWRDYPKESDELDTSLFSNLRWPFAKLKLEVPRAELQRIKIDLLLLFAAVKVLGATTATERQRLAQPIPELHRARAWAAKRAERVKEMAQHRIRSSRAHDMPWSDEEPEMLEEFLTFKERLILEEEEKKIRERADIIRAEDNARKQREEDAQREVERKAVEEYKKTQRDQEARSHEKRDNFRKELERLGLESAQIQLVMDSSNLDFQAATGMALVPEVRPSASLREIPGEQEMTHSATSGWSRLNLPWRRPKRSTQESSSDSSLSSVLLENRSGPHLKLEFETWLLDYFTHQSTELLPSNNCLLEKSKSMKKEQEVWSRFARLRPYWRTRVFNFLSEHSAWTLYHLEVSQKSPRTRLFGQKHDDQSMLLVLCRRRVDDQDSDVSEGGPKVDDPGGGLPKRVTFVGGVDEKSGTDRGSNGVPNDVLTKHTSSLRERVVRLEEKRNGLGVHDHDRIADLTEMIDYLQEQLKTVGTQASILDTETAHDERKSQPSRQASVPLYENHIPESSPQDDIIIEYRRPPSRTRSPPRRQNNKGAVSIANSYPRQIEDKPENYSSPERTRYESRRAGERDHNRQQLRRREEEDINVYRRGDDRSSRRGWSEEDIIVRPRDHDRSSRREWPEEEIDVRSRDHDRSLRREWSEEDIIVRSRDHDRSWQREWPGRSEPRSRPSRQDTVDTYGGPVVIRARNRSWERSRPQPLQPSGQLSKLTDRYEYPERPTLANDIRPRERISEREEERWRPEMHYVPFRREQSSKPKLHNEQYLSSSESEYSYNGSRVRRGQPVVRPSGQSQALVLRAGASGHPYDYVRERVLNGGIRVRGDDDVNSRPLNPAVSQHIRRASQPPFSRRNSYRDRSWAPSLRRRFSDSRLQFDSSEDEQSRYRSIKRVHSEKVNPETELSDAEVIAQTLNKYTTIKDKDMPTTGVPTPSPTDKASELEIGQSAPNKPPHALSGPDSKRSLSVPGRKAQFEQQHDAPQKDQEGLGKATKEGSNSADEISFMDKISEEPEVMNEDDDMPQQPDFVLVSARPTPPGPQHGAFPPSPALATPYREGLSRSQSRDSNPDSPRIRPQNETPIGRHARGENPYQET